MVRTLAGLLATRVVPKHIRSDNGPEFIAQRVRSWLEENKVGQLYIEPGGRRGRTAWARVSTASCATNA